MFVEEKTQGEAPPVKVGMLKLSDAIRIGARLRPQGRETLFSNGKSCALGAAYEAVYGDPGRDAGFPDLPHDARNKDDVFGQRLDESFPALNTRLGGGFRVKDQVWRKNDNERWSREKIADWLESQGF